jgi:ribonuclease R
MEFDSEGNRINYVIYESLILSRHRLTYTAVQDILDGDAAAKNSSPELISDVLVMNDLKELLKKKREVRGCLDFDLPESELVLNMQGDVESIVKRPRLEAHMLIEEFMIAANEAVAEFMFFKKRPFIYRIHEEPDQSSLAEYHELSDHLGHPLPRSYKPDPKVYSDLLEKIKNLPEEKILNTALLRSMKQARYSEKNSGHFGLASKCYTHFTSPIRRYPDLIVHRLLKEELKKKTKFSDTKSDPEGEEKIRTAAYHCSNRERLIEGAEREFMALKKAQFMRDKVGSQFEGYISGMIEFGFFVELASYFVEGFVPLSTLHDDRYQFIPERYLIRGRRFRQEFHLGQKVLVEVRSVNLDKRQIDFRLIE